MQVKGTAAYALCGLIRRSRSASPVWVNAAPCSSPVLRRRLPLC